MEEEILKKYLKAAEIEKKVIEEAKRIVEPGVKILDIVNSLEGLIAKLGGSPAFPVNVSLNEIAAHDTAAIEDERTIEKGVVKVDIGVHFEGYIADSAFTVDFSGESGKLLEATERALEEAVSVIKAGTSTSEIGSVVEETIKKAGFKPVENLTGHTLGEYSLHAGAEIPNFSARGGFLLKDGDVVAIEPFATNGEGYVVETQTYEILSAIFLQPTRNLAAREMFNFLSEKYKYLPFAERWVIKNLKEREELEKRIAIRELIRNGSVKAYPVLRERAKGVVAQFEHTVIVEKDSARILV